MSALGHKRTYAPQKAPPIATSIAFFGMSALGQKRTSPQLVNHLISAGEQRRRHSEAECLRSLEIDLAFSAAESYRFQLRWACLEPRFGFDGFQSEQMETANDASGSIPSASRTTTRIRPKARGRRLRG